MKLQYTKQYFIDRIKRLDVRADALDDITIDLIISDGFAEVSTLGMFFSDEEVVSMEPYYADGELQLTLDIEEDVTAIYDYYLTTEGEAFELYSHGIRKMQKSDVRRLDGADVNSMWLDSRYNGRVHINLEQVYQGKIIDNAVIKYFYIPTANTDTYYMDNQTRLATESGMASALYEYLHDVERAGQKRAAMTRQAMAIVPLNPEDLGIESPQSMFPFGT